MNFTLNLGLGFSPLEVLVYAVSAFGVFFIVGLSGISFPIHQRLPMFIAEGLQCPGCFGWWEGVVSMFLLTPDLSPPFSRFLVVFVAGAFTAGSNMLLARFAGVITDSSKETP